MKRITLHHRPRGFTLTELCVTVGVVMVVGIAAYSVLLNSTTLLAKNISINSSNILARAALDRIFNELNQGNRLPSLINADGTAASGMGPAAGILYDRYIGGPFVVGNPNGTGLAANTTSIKLYYSIDANPPQPQKNDVVIMDGATRALISSVGTPTASLAAPIPTPAPSGSTGRMVTVTLPKSLGNYTNPTVSSGVAIPWSASTQQIAYLVHRKAFVVVPGAANSAAELRLYPDAETVTNWNDPSNYIVLSRNVGNKTGENTPFSLVDENRKAPKTLQDAKFLTIDVRVEDQTFNKRLSTQQANELNTFFRADTMVRPRNIPST